MRIVIVACALGLCVLGAGSLLGVASGETSTAGTAQAPTTAVPSVSVQGVASVPIAQNASAPIANAAYRQGMGEALSDGQSKAQFLASKAAVNLGPVQNMLENGGYIQCAGEAEYEGTQPDFGSVGGSNVIGATPSPVLASRVGAVSKKPRAKHHKKPRAKKATAGSCTLSTEVTVVYQLS